MLCSLICRLCRFTASVSWPVPSQASDNCLPSAFNRPATLFLRCSNFSRKSDNVSCSGAYDTWRMPENVTQLLFCILFGQNFRMILRFAYLHRSFCGRTAASPSGRTECIDMLHNSSRWIARRPLFGWSICRNWIKCWVQVFVSICHTMWMEYLFHWTKHLLLQHWFWLLRPASRTIVSLPAADLCGAHRIPANVLTHLLWYTPRLFI